MRRMHTKKEIGGGSVTPDALLENMQGSETVVVDLDESNSKVEIRLDNDYKNKVDKALVTPVSAPESTELVAIGAGNTQERVIIGAGLTLTGDTSPKTLTASGGGMKLYLHDIGSGTPVGAAGSLSLYLINTESTPYASFAEVLAAVKEITTLSFGYNSTRHGTPEKLIAVYASGDNLNSIIPASGSSAGGTTGGPAFFADKFTDDVVTEL